MGILTIQPAVRKGAHVIIGLYGESGSGKTYSAIHLARGLVGPEGKFCLLDTETGRGLIYANEAGGFDYAELTPPWTPERYTDAIKEVEAAGYQALVIDSASHEWEGLGGILEMADASEAKGLAKWARPKAKHKAFVQAMLRTRMHLILCLRAKEKLVQKGSEIVSAGLVSVQDKRFIYEMTVQCRMLSEPGKSGLFVLEKCPGDLRGAFPDGQPISIASGEKIAAWVAGGAPVDHRFEALKKSGEDAAESGTDALKVWFKGLPKADQATMKPYLDGNLKSIAAAADDNRGSPANANAGPIRPAYLAGALAQVAGAETVDEVEKIKAATMAEFQASDASAELRAEFLAACEAALTEIKGAVAA